MIFLSSSKDLRKECPSMFPKSGGPLETDTHSRPLINIPFGVPSKGVLPPGPPHGVPCCRCLDCSKPLFNVTALHCTSVGGSTVCYTVFTIFVHDPRLRNVMFPSCRSVEIGGLVCCFSNFVRMTQLCITIIYKCCYLLRELLDVTVTNLYYPLVYSVSTNIQFFADCCVHFRFLGLWKIEIELSAWGT